MFAMFEAGDTFSKAWIFLDIFGIFMLDFWDVLMYTTWIYF